MAAMKFLDYEEYLGFLGATPEEHRLSQFHKLAKDLPEESRAYWKNSLNIIQKGVLYQGALERFLQYVRVGLEFMRREKIETLFRFTDLDEQRHFIQTQWDTPTLRRLARVVLSTFFTRTVVKDPGLYKHIGPSIDPATYIYDRWTRGLMNGLVRENALLSLIFKKRVAKEAFPPYLCLDGYTSIKPHLSRLKNYTANLVEFLEKAPENSFDVFSVSDVASYLSTEQFNRLIHGIYRTAKPNARFCMREFMSSHRIPYSMQKFFVRNPHLENKLAQEDRCFVYRFMTGNIIKSNP
jgi:S-adenosylmethionine-diacylglycerol 3-amino-3-carboxypropyl transferase